VRVAAGRSEGSDRLRFAIVGCGDVAFRRYLPTLAELRDEVEVVACVDGRTEAAERAVALVGDWSPRAAAHPDVASALEGAAGQPRTRPDAAVVLSPAPTHAAVTTACLEAGLDVYSEKPIAGSLDDADRLVATADTRGLTLLVAPGSAATRRVRWLREIVAARRFGPLTLAVAHHADSGPATWREYTGDPTVFYGPGVGPVFDHGIYRLHELTTLMGPVRRVQAMGSISRPTRVVRAGPLLGREIPIAAPDHVMVNMEFASGALGQLLASFGTASTLAPWLELHFAEATISMTGESWDKDAPANLYLDDDSSLGLEGWVRDLQPPPVGEPWGVVETGIRHFVDCLRGRAIPVLSAEQARHVLDVVLCAYESIEDGGSHATTTTF